MVDAATGENLLDELRGLLRTTRAMVFEQSRVRGSDDLIPEAITALMVRISDAGSCRSSELAEHLRLSPSVLSRQLAQAESMGYIDRAVDEYDRRAALVSLSTDGRAALKRHRRAQLATFLALLDDWNDDEAASCRHHVNRLRTALDSHRPVGLKA